MDNMQKGFLIAGGLLLLGLLGYTLFGKKEEEIEDTEYIIVVDTNSGETKTQEKKKETDSKASEEMTKPNISIIKNENVPIREVSEAEIPEGKIESTSLPEKVEENEILQTLEMKVVKASEEIDPQQDKNVNALEVVEPQEVIAEANDDFPLKLGSKGQRVWDLKVYLMKNHGGAGIITNEFDNQTAERVKRFLKVEQVSQQLYTKLSIGHRKKKRNVTTTKKKH